ncbi:MAG: hypothetical protein AAGM46_07525 [Cyanobacteria bacterium J06582_2]
MLNIVIDERSPSASWRNIWLKYLQSGGLNEIADRPLILNQYLSGSAIRF